MYTWKPPGNVEETPARWEANPERSTFFLQALVDASRDGKFRNTPNNAAYKDISKLFWARYNIYHTPKQFRNYYSNRKSFWATVSWARGSTGIGWDDAQKMILASNEWWQENQGRKGLLLLKDKPIVDFDLLETLFGRQRVVAKYAYSPFQPIPLSSDEGSGDSDNPEESQFFDPQLHQPSQASGSLSTTSTQKRKAAAQGNKKAKKTKKKGENEESLSPFSANITKGFNVWSGLKDKKKRLAFESEVAGQPPSNEVQAQSVTITSPSNMDKCLTIMTDLLKISPASQLFQYATDFLMGNPDAQSVFLVLKNSDDQLAWLHRKLPPVVRPDTGYDLNQPPGGDDS